MGENLYASDLIDDLGTPPWLANKVARLYSYEQLAAASLDDLMDVFGKPSLSDLKKIKAHAKIKTGAKPSVGTRDELPQDSVAALYRLIGKAVAVWCEPGLNSPHEVVVGSTRMWVQRKGIDLLLSGSKPVGSTPIRNTVSDPASLFEFLQDVGDQFSSISATELLQALIDYAEAYHTID